MNYVHMPWVVIFGLIAIFCFMWMFHRLKIVNIPFFEKLDNWSSQSNISMNVIIICVMLILIILYFLTT